MSESKVKSIQDLLDLAEEHQMPLEKMRFFIGKDCKEAKCFGIYQDADGNWIVYKNKTDGSRAVRYKGKSEEEAVGIIFEKLHDEIRKRQKDRDWWDHQERMAKDRDYAEEYQKEMTRRAKKRHARARSRRASDIVSTGVALAVIATPFAWGAYSVYDTLKDSQKNSEIREALSSESNGYYSNGSGHYYYLDGYKILDYDTERNDWYEVYDGYDYDDYPTDWNTYTYYPDTYTSSDIPLSYFDSNYYQRLLCYQADSGYYIDDTTDDTYYLNYGTWYLYDQNSGTWGDYDEIPAGWNTSDFSFYDDTDYETAYDGSDLAVSQSFSDYYDERYESSSSYSYDSDYDSDWSSDWDSSYDYDDYDYDYDSWDSSSTDWDSDW